MSDLGELLTGLYKEAASNAGRDALIGAGLGAAAGAGKYYLTDEKKRKRKSLLNHVLGGGAVGAAGGAALSALPGLAEFANDKVNTGGSTAAKGLFGGGATAARLLGLGYAGRELGRRRFFEDSLAGAAATPNEVPSWLGGPASALGVKAIKPDQGMGGGGGKVTDVSDVVNNAKKVLKKYRAEGTPSSARNAARRAFESHKDVDLAKAGPSMTEYLGLLGPQALRHAGSSETVPGMLWRGAMDATSGASLASMLMGRGRRGLGRSTRMIGGAGLGALVGLLADKGNEYMRRRTEDGLRREGVL